MANPLLLASHLSTSRDYAASISYANEFAEPMIPLSLFLSGEDQLRNASTPPNHGDRGRRPNVAPGTEVQSFIWLFPGKFTGAVRPSERSCPALHLGDAVTIPSHAPRGGI